MMTKKLILPLLMMLVSLTGLAQYGVGDWRLHVPFEGNKVSNVYETRRCVYYLAGNSLFRLDKETNENESLSVMNDLSDMMVTSIYYNNRKDYLVVVYSNSNLDVIQSDGSVVNMPEIKDAVFTTSKKINDVTFAAGLIYLATDFGYVVVDDTKFVVKESYLFGDPLVSVAQVGDMLLLSSPDHFYYGEADEYHEQLSTYAEAPFGKNDLGGRIKPIDETTFFYIPGWSFHYRMTVNGDGTATFAKHTILEFTSLTPQATVDGFLLNAPSRGQCYKTGPDGYTAELIDDVQGEICSSNPDGQGDLWGAGSRGLHVVNSENYYLPNALSISTPFWMTYNKDKDLLYVTPPGTNGFFTDTTTAVNTFDGIRWADVTPAGAPSGGCFWIEFLPDDPNTYFLGTYNKGLLKVVNNELVFTYDNTNSALLKRGTNYPVMHPVTSIDRYGNLWVAQPYENKEDFVMVLPAAKAKLNETTADDWVKVEMRGLYADNGHTQRCRFLSTRHSNYDIKIFTDGDKLRPVFFLNSNGSTSGNPQVVSKKELTDQDGQTFTWTNVMCFEEDLNGIVWMGCTEGVVNFNPGNAFSDDFRINRIKVPRNDGTGMADYLLDGIQVNDIAVDGANRKWIATQTSGLFLVSADGSQVISRFNQTNSPLASNTVYQVCCNPNSNSVYLTTPAGLYEYFSDSSPAEPNYDNIYAYPNPVRPDFLGDVTIMGLMDNSLIKIADASGNVIRQIKSTGGMATWDCCDQNGERAKTGIYFVLCSRANGSGEAVVTKIAVIR